MVSGDKQLNQASEASSQGWNELDFVPWRSFRRMAPSILNLEVSRLQGLIAGTGNVEYRNALVQSRFELEAFVEALQGPEIAPDRLPLTRLQAAILNLPLEHPGMEADDAQTLAYILDRLQYVHTRIRFVYQ